MSDIDDCISGGIRVTADPDVSGIGVILSFLITAWLSFIIAVVAFFLVDDIVPKKLETPLDRLVRWLVRYFIPKGADDKLLWNLDRDLMEQVCMTFADQQLITGASILIVCYSTHDTISQYHFAVGTSLSFASLGTFMSSAVVASRSLRENNLKKTWRYIWIVLTMAAMTLASFVFSEQEFLRPGHWGSPTQCVFDRMAAGDAAYTSHGIAVLTIWTILAFDSLMSMAKFLWPDAPVPRFYDGIIAVFPTAPILAIMFVDRTFLKPHHGRLRKGVGYVLLAPLLVIFWITFVVFEIYYSVNFDLFRTFIILFITSVGVSYFRTTAGQVYLDESEDEWGFGQILPMLLLALPLFNSAEIIVATWRTRKESKKLRNEGPKIENTQNPTPQTGILTSQPSSGSVTAVAAPKSETGSLASSITPVRLRSLTLIAHARTNSMPVHTTQPRRRGFLRMLDLQQLTVDEMEEVLYDNNPVFKISMVLLLAAAYPALAFLTYWYDFVI